jgi:hypothetical protein
MAQIVEPIKLTQDEKSAMASILDQEILDAESQHSQFFLDILTWWKWYEALPKEKKKNMPWEGASNVVLPVIGIAVDSLVANFFGLIFSHGRVWVGKTRNEAFEEFVTPLSDFLNWSIKNEMDIEMPIWDWLTELVAIGESFLGLRYEEAERWVNLPGGGKAPRKVTIHRGPVLEHIPRHQILIQPGREVDNSEWIIRQTLMTFSDLARKAQNDGWDAEAIDRCRSAPETDRRPIRVTQERLSDAGQTLQPPNYVNLFHDVRTCWLDWPMVQNMNTRLGHQMVNDKISNLVVMFHVNTRQVLHVMPDPYGLGHKPFYRTYLRKRSGTPTGQGIAKMLEHSQRAMSTMVNQSIDGITLNNSMPFATTNPKIANGHFHPARPLLLDNMGELQELKNYKNVQPETTIVNLVQMFAERRAGVSDPLLGRESRSGGHPSPATNFLGMLEQGKRLQTPTMVGIRKVLGDVGKDLLTLYQLFDTDESGRIDRVFGQKDGEKIKAFIMPTEMPILGNLELDVFAANENENPQARQQKAVVVSQMTNNYYSGVLPMVQAALTPQMPNQMKVLVFQAIEGMTKSLINFLDASDIDDIENYTLTMGELEQHGLRDLESFQRALRQLAASQPGAGAGPVQQPPMGGIGEPPPQAAGLFG